MVYIKLIAIVCPVIITGVKGIGKEMYAATQIIAIQMDIFVKSLVFILFSPHYIIY